MIPLEEPREIKKTRARDRTKIFYDILRSVIRLEASAGVAKITWVQNEVNVPSDRFRAHLKQMHMLGLIEYRDTIASTGKGREFVSEYEKVLEVLRRFGLA